METNWIKIACLEDSEFYNLLLRRHLQAYTKPIAETLGIVIDVQTYTQISDFMRNLSPETRIVLLDYYLGGHHNGEQVLKEMRRMGHDCKVILLTQCYDERIAGRVLDAGADEVIFKDRSALQRTALVVESMLWDQVTPSA